MHHLSLTQYYINESKIFSDIVSIHRIRYYNNIPIKFIYWWLRYLNYTNHKTNETIWNYLIIIFNLEKCYGNGENWLWRIWNLYLRHRICRAKGDECLMRRGRYSEGTSTSLEPRTKNQDSPKTFCAILVLGSWFQWGTSTFLVPCQNTWGQTHTHIHTHTHTTGTHTYKKMNTCIHIYIYGPLQNWPQNSRSQKGYKTP